ncbi:tyrosine-type recombinase/integrase [Actinokineospora iranica]|uniref:Phage integrase, N-terminal SAM-like domain n=1 Tax=Actinokineospora iranica TaxID=1271860 RepID=A0A1G6YZD3_9PSEU|nr:site-specific integrase [Actinokineospora iranica]SDD95005.1 Phage integrase, N-terminal SAM-like domain [Actinokineospora iranica]
MSRKKRPEGTRRPNGTSTVYYSEYDGKWHGRVTMGVKDDGRPDRRHVKRATEAEAIKAVQELEAKRSTGDVTRPGTPWKVEKWLTHWLDTIATPSITPNAASAYRYAVNKWLIPGIGGHRLDRLQPEHLEALYAKMLAAGKAPGYAHQVHRTIKTALNVAHARGRITRNPAELAKAPKLAEDEIVPFTVDEARKILRAARDGRNGVRYSLALTLGLRKGETLGLKWSRIDLDNGVLRTPKQIQRHRWQHGCDDPHECGARLHKTKPCKPDCTVHRRKPCPPVCAPNCAKHASACPQRHSGGLREVDVKSRAGRRGVGIPKPLLRDLVEHKARQDAERRRAGSVWQEGGWVFTQPTGRPVDPRADHDEWKALLDHAGVREARLHDARHTAATMLLVLGVPPRAVMEIMGWSQLSMTARYQHVSAELVASIANQMEGLFWKD